MISLRYHITSIVAVFLSLGLGILLGATVLDAAIVDRLESDIERARQSRDAAQGDLREAASSLAGRDQQLGQVAEYLLADRLSGRTVVTIVDGDDEAWHADIDEALTASAATHAGTIRLTERWVEPETQDTMRALTERHEIAVEEGRPPSDAVLTRLGSGYASSQGRALLDDLVDDGFLRIEGRGGQAAWPPVGSAFVAYLSTAEPNAVTRHVALIDGIAASAALLVAAPSTDAAGAVAVLREREELPPTLSTFNGASQDPSGVASVLALDAALDGRGGHFGISDGRRFVPEPA